MKKCWIIFFVFFIVLFLPSRSFGQSPGIICRHYNIQNGLISNNIEFVYVDKEGYTWFATGNGLQQFDGYNFTNYNYNADDTSSISYNFISSISEDTSGNIWIGTVGKGINILNKEKRIFYHLYNDSSHPQVITSNNIPRGLEDFALDEAGSMWVNTDNGLNKINTSDFHAEHYFGDFTGGILYDKTEKVLWIASNVLKKFNPATNQIDYYQISSGSKRNQINVNSFLMDDRGLLWLGTSAGLLIFDKTKRQFYTLDEYFSDSPSHKTVSYKWSSNDVESIYADNQGFIWIAIEKSIVRLDKYKGSYQLFTHEIDNPGSLQDSKVVGIYGNNSRALWVAYTTMGVSKMNIALKAFKNYKSVSGNPNTLSGNSVRSVYMDNKQNLWIGNYSDGLNRIISKGPDMFHFKYDPLNPHSINSNYITAIYVDRKERLWVGTFDKGFCYADNLYRNSNLIFNRMMFDQNLEVQDFAEDINGNIWIGTQVGFYFYDYSTDELVHYGDLKNQLSDLQQFNIQSVIYEPPDIFWVTSWNRGIFRLKINSDARLSKHISEDSLIIYESIKDINQSNIDNCFITLCKDDNAIWLGSNVNGLIKMMPQRDSIVFIKYDQSKGAPGNSVYGIIKDKFNNIWISTNHGLGKFNPRNENFSNYYESDGLPSNAFVWNSFFQSMDGQAYFGGINGLITFYPEQLTEDTIKNRVCISKLIVQNRDIQVGNKIGGRQILSKNIQYTESITLTYKEPAFTIEFAALNALNPEEINYSYKLEGFDEDWIPSTSQKRYVTYTNLPAGNYNFYVKASTNIADSDQKTTSLKIIILPPWWKTPFAAVAFTLFFIFLLFCFRWLILMRVRLVHQAKLEHLEREKTEELYQFKMRFFTDISHEFRTPLSLILAPLQKIISKVENDPQVIKQSQLIKKNADRLLRLIDQVMDMSKIDLNKMKLMVVKGDIIGTIKELTLSFEEIATQRSMILEFTSEVNTYVTWFDENKLEKIICNLLSNSFKFTADKGKIQVIVSIRKNENKNPAQKASEYPDKEFLEIRVMDNGIGMPEGFKNHLFERFFIIEKFDSIVRRGTGIGLALTKELVELQKGKIEVESEEKKGSCFIVQLPLIDNPEKCGDVEISERTNNLEQCKRITSSDDHEYVFRHSKQENDSNQDKNKKVILLVEDDQEVRNFIRDNFGTGYQVYEAPDGRKGLDIAIRVDPDIIICDIIMPVMNGIEMCQKIKSDLRTSHVPVILLTARTSVENKIEGLTTGADAYIEKPFSIDLLEVQVNNILENRKLLRTKFSKELILQPSEIAITSVDALFLQKAIEIVENHISDPGFSAEEFCKEIGMSRSQLHRKLKGLTSQPASGFIRTLRLKRAINLLEQSHLSVEEISYKVGFSSPAYFTKCFKILFGKPPSIYSSR